MPLATNSSSTLVQKLRRDVFGRFPREIWVITAIQVFIAAGYSVSFPFLALYLHQERDLSMTLVGVMFLIGGLCSSATQMIGGALTDRFGRRSLLLWTMGISVFVLSGLAVSVGVTAPIWVVMLTYILGQSILMMAGPAIRAMVADLSPKDRLTETYSLMRVGVNAGFAAGPALGGYLLTIFPYAWLLGAAVLASAVAFFLALFFVKESFHGSTKQVGFRSVFSVATDRAFLIFNGLIFLSFLSMAQFGSTLSVFTVDRIGFTIAQYGLLLTINCLIVVVFQYPVSRGVDKLPRARGFVLGSLFYGLGWLLFAWITDFSWAVMAMVVVTAGEIIVTPLALSVVAEFSPEDKRGRYMGFFGLSTSLSASSGPLLGGILLDAFPANPLFIWGIIASVAFVAAAGFQWWGMTQFNTKKARGGDAVSSDPYP